MKSCIVADCPEQNRKVHTARGAEYAMDCLYLRCKVPCRNPAHRAEWEAAIAKEVDEKEAHGD